MAAPSSSRPRRVWRWRAAALVISGLLGAGGGGVADERRPGARLRAAGLEGETAARRIARQGATAELDGAVAGAPEEEIDGALDLLALALAAGDPHLPRRAVR